MHVIYIPKTEHILAVMRGTGIPTPTPASVSGDGMRVGGMLRARPAAEALWNWGTPTVGDEEFSIPARELATREMTEERGVYACPYRYVVDTTGVAQIPASTFRLRVQMDHAGTRVRITTPAVFGAISFPASRRVWIQIEGPTAVDRRILAGMIPAGQSSPFDFPITVDADGPLAPLATGARYHLLVLIEGFHPDARTQVL
jgi:hypothetical protein